ncbi:uncharacterized protein VDAG_05164 [Verticillium dahliae VdLs.17]|uniref:Uncharacterized protein n=1 Tax=Verticillium dahliae (strain VdLs.17 / ATCC MYA-4575 / FGSC 10137) TaxID=498257 RepID=G2X4T2_VERDV|nr:uncharacterized protein VDAG_05164 [Verticillium dahliae VdLs.17]EGY23726.1 hypothetical protein VDAG_05164 [Verticillium dahliae VdLs.17]
MFSTPPASPGPTICSDGAIRRRPPTPPPSNASSVDQIATSQEPGINPDMNYRTLVTDWLDRLEPEPRDENLQGEEDPQHGEYLLPQLLFKACELASLIFSYEGGQSDFLWVLQGGWPPNDFIEVQSDVSLCAHLSNVAGGPKCFVPHPDLGDEELLLMRTAWESSYFDTDFYLYIVHNIAHNAFEFLHSV